MKKEEVILTNLEQIVEHSEVEGFLTVGRYLKQTPSNTLQYLHTSSDGSLLEVDIYATVDGQLRKSVSFESHIELENFDLNILNKIMEQ